MMVQIVIPEAPPGRNRKHKIPQLPVFFAEPVTPSNSFVGTEEYIAPVRLSNIFYTWDFLFKIVIQTKVLQASIMFLMYSWICRKSLRDKGIVVLWIGGLLVRAFSHLHEHTQPLMSAAEI
jgi:hypothetical protein